MLRTTILILALMTTSLFAGQIEPLEKFVPPQNLGDKTVLYKVGAVNRVSDGDTVYVRILLWTEPRIHVTEKVRLLGFDAWETRRIEKGPKDNRVRVTDEEVEKGKKAKEFLTNLLTAEGTEVYVATRFKRDHPYQRLLAHLYVVRGEDGQMEDVATIMKENGHERVHPEKIEPTLHILPGDNDLVVPLPQPWNNN